MDYSKLAPDETIAKTKAALEKNGYTVIVVENGAKAKEQALALVPKGAEVFALSSETLRATGLTSAIDESGDYKSVRSELNKLDRNTQAMEMQKLGAAPQYALGSVHALTEDGKVLIASNTGSQLAADAYGATNVIWVIGAQKIVPSEEEAKKRIYEYVLPLESARINKQYNMTSGSFVSTILTFYRSFNPKRVTVILVKEILGF